MQTLAKLAAKTIEGYKANKIIMDFVTNQALEKVSAEVSAKPGRVCTVAALTVLLQSASNKDIKNRVDEYIQAGLFGCFIKSLNC